MAQGDAHFSSTSPFVHHQYVYAAYTYDAWGNRASMTGNGTSSTYTYDANNRLTKSITEEGSTTTTADYYYDHNGNQITKAVSVTTNWVSSKMQKKEKYHIITEKSVFMRYWWHPRPELNR